MTDHSDFDQNHAHKPFGHSRMEWGNRFHKLVDNIMEWPAENWLIFGSGLLVGLFLG